MIRELKSFDDAPLAQIERLGHLFTEETNLGLSFDIGHFVSKLKYALDLGVAKIWVLEKDTQVVGIIGGIASQLFFVKETIAVEMFWFVDKENRGGIGAMRLLDAFEEWASREAEAIHFAYMENIHPERMKEFLEKHGYSKLETIYRKKV